MKYSVENGVHIVEVPATDVRITMVDTAKKTAAEKNYCNAGFFAGFSENGQAFTLPVGHIVCDYAATNEWTKHYCEERGSFDGDKFTFDASKWSYNNPFCGKAISTLIIKDGEASIVDTVALPSCDYAISGVPIMRNGEDVKFATYVKGQGWGGSSLYATWHIFVGVRDAHNLCIVCMKTTTSNMIKTAEAFKKFKALGFIDVIKLDGGGSTYFNANGETVSTSENRRINSIISFVDKEEPPLTDREKVVSIMQSWLGKKESDGSFKGIIDLYNAHTPLARGYKVKYTDEWCATTVSAAFIKAGLTDIAPTECSCAKMIELHKALGQWIEDDSYIPSPGDVLMYDWGDDGKNDNKGNPDHVGIVEKVVGQTITVIEGNINSAVGRRNLAVNGRYIRGYCVPNYPKEASTGGNISLPTLKNGSKGDSVKALQILLNGFGYSCGTADGIWGSKTQAAVIKFQKVNGLTQDGIVGNETWSALLL